MQLNGAQALIKALEMEGVEVIFGLPGGAILCPGAATETGWGPERSGQWG